MQFRVGSQRIAVNVADAAALEAALRQRFAAGQGFSLATLNLDHLVKLRGNAAFGAAYEAQDLVTADGNPIVWMAALAGQPVTLMPGSDLVVPMCRIAAEMGVKVGLVGSTQSSLDRAGEVLAAKVPGLQVVAAIAPPMGFDPAGPVADGILAQLQAAGAGLCFVALGAPKQELFAAHGRGVVPGMGFAGVGASLDFLAGTQVRAPNWMRAIAMEWVWRLICEPRRLGPRYFQSALILPGHMLRSLGMRLRRA